MKSIVRLFNLIEKAISSKIFVLLSVFIFCSFAKHTFFSNPSDRKGYLVIIYLGIYIIVQLILVLLNKNAIPQSEKLSYGVKLLFINIFLVVYLTNDFKYIEYITSIVGIGLLMDSLTQFLKLFDFSKQLVALNELSNKGVDLSVYEAKHIIRLLNPSYHYFYIKDQGTKFEAIDEETFKRLQDFYIGSTLVRK